MNRRVVVTGIGMITAHGIGIKANWTKIKSGMSSIQEIASFDSSKYRGKTGGEAREFSTATLNNLKNKRLDRASHLLIHTTREALADANIIDAVKNIPVLLSVGTTLGGMISGEIFHKEVIKRGLNRAKVSRVFDYLAHYQAIHLFKELELKGDFFVFSNACASGTDAIGHAFNSIRHGDYDVAICGGYDTMSEFSFAGFNSLMAITPTLCMPFDKKREGLVLGEGAGVLILEELEHAHKRNARILGEIAGYGASSDACHMTSPEPSGKGAAIAIKRALKDAGHPEIDYINAHGTGTKYNDIMETNAVVIAFESKAKEIPVSSIKPMIGHLLGGAGAVEAIVSLLSILYKTLIPNINYTTPDPECALNIVRESMGCNIKTVLSNSFGFGGSNAAIIIREYVWRN
ncbi:MAG: beta-ketoacyl-[acyl-carrier-protein] synthase family protein [Candidatus Brocadia sp.]|uniref:Nodulation protein E n=1 Tax=Candidatus Brocadia fulgida TaxID=380242 RepID=A0A0M2UTQ8_9BACT|nr:MAG: putative beta-ketoacyl (acyl carrier protein) synthase [Candidatus Brocadia fulgida]UJS20479.1 MAG: beta-ketoacyl-[acyl-carrier-protein] synthase family protein [Candidatus Brocadia sp.]